MKHIIKISFVILIFCFVSSEITAQVPFKIGSESLIPFEFMDGNKPRGINIQLVDTIFKRMNIPYEIVFGTEANRALDMIQQGKLDAILSVSFAPERTNYLVYPKGFDKPESAENFMWASEYVFFCKKGKVTSYAKKTLAEFSQSPVIVGVIEGLSYSTEFWNAGLTVKKYANDQENFLALQRGDIDVLITDKTIGRFTLRKLDLEKDIAYLPQKWISKPYTLALSAKSKHPMLEKVKAEFYKELHWAQKSGLARKYFMNYLQQAP